MSDSDRDNNPKETFEVHEDIADGRISNVSHSIEAASPEEIRFVAKILGFQENADFDINEPDFRILLSGILEFSNDHAREVVQETLVEHADDRNFPYDLTEYMETALEVSPKDAIEEGISGNFLLRTCAGIMRYSSPYPEVRSTTYFHDDPEELCETARAYFLATVWVGVYAFVGQFFEIRQPGISLSAVLLQMFVVPCGMFLARVLPDWGVTIRGKRHSLNPGPWSHKEQSFVTVVFGQMGVAYVDSQILVQKLPVFYGQEWAGLGYQICMILSTQFIGFGFAGVFRNIIVYPVQNIWMSNFPSLALNKAFLSPDDRKPVHGWKITRWHFFGFVFVAVFLYEWLPLYLMQFLSYFNWMCWIAPNNFNLATVTGMIDGMGFNPIATFDINYITNLISPVFSTVNNYIGAVLGGLTILGIYYSNMYNTAYLPINSNSVFTNTGEYFHVAEVLTDGVLDPEKYQQYSPPFYAAANLVGYGAFFAVYMSVIVNSLLYDWKIIIDAYTQFFKSLFGKHRTIRDYNDPHSRLMAKYPETPQWWFIVVLLISLALALVTIKAFPTQAPVWGLFMALGITVVFLVPVGILQARANSGISTNVLVELIIGYAKPGHGVAMMLIKAFGVNSHSVALSYLSNLKFAHYAKIPPRAAFRGQVWATLVSLFIVWGVVQFQLTGIDGICTHAQLKTTKFTCPGETTYFSASIIWGVIGPKRIFDSQYPILKWCFLIGAVIPLPFYFARRFLPKWRKSLLLVEPSIVIIGFISYAPANLAYLTGALYINLLFVGYIRRRYVKWFEKYNYVLSAAIDAALSLSAFIIFFSVQYHTKDLEWWGNDVIGEGIDGSGAALLPIPPEGYFGSGPGTYYY